MATRQDVLGLLKAVGAIEVGVTLNSQSKWKLPSGELFRMSLHSSGDIRGYENAMAQLRRMIRFTHPELVKTSHKKHTPPKIRRGPTTTLGDLMTPEMLKDLGVQDKPIFKPIMATEIEPKTHPTYVEELPPYVPPRRQRSEPTAKHGEVKTFTKEQLDEANGVLKTQGEQGLKSFCEQVHTEMVPVTPEIVRQRVPEPVKETMEVTTPPAVAVSGDEMIHNVQAEIATTRDGISRLQVQVQSLKDQIEAEEYKVLQLEDYVDKHRKLMEESQSVLQLLTPKTETRKAEPKTTLTRLPEPVPILRSKSFTESCRSAKKIVPRNPEFFAGAKEIREIVLPEFRRRGMKGFTVDDVLEVLRTTKTMTKEIPDKKKFYNTVYIYGRDVKSGYHKSSLPNYFEFDEVARAAQQPRTKVPAGVIVHHNPKQQQLHAH